MVEVLCKYFFAFIPLIYLIIVIKNIFLMVAISVTTEVSAVIKYYVLQVL